jgi:hypothetical protein
MPPNKAQRHFRRDGASTLHLVVKLLARDPHCFGALERLSYVRRGSSWRVRRRDQDFSSAWHCPAAFAIALERMQPKRGPVHILRVAGLVQRRED